MIQAEGPCEAGLPGDKEGVNEDRYEVQNAWQNRPDGQRDRAWGRVAGAPQRGGGQGRRERWIIQGHLGATWQNGQYVRTREMKWVKEAFADLLARLETDYIDLGMLHFVDEVREFHQVMEGEFYAYAAELKAQGVIRHIGMSTHNPEVAALAAKSGKIEMLRHASGQRRYDGIFQRRLRGGTGRNCA